MADKLDEVDIIEKFKRKF
jgi:hypothetical protein